MADETEYRIPIIADIGDLLSKFAEAGQAAQEMGEQMSSAGDKGKEGLAKLGEGSEEAGARIKELKENMDEQAEGVAKAVGSWQGLMQVLGMGGVMEILNKVAETTMEVGDSMAITSATLGIGTNEARGFNEAMESLGVSSGAAAGAIRRMQGDVETGGKHLAQLGITMDDVKSKYSDGLSLFEAVIEKLNNMAPTAERNAVAYALLGRGAMQLLGVLGDVNPAIEKNIEEQQRNQAVNRQLNDNALVLHSTLTNMKSAWDDLAGKLSGTVADAFTEINQMIHDCTSWGQSLWDTLRGFSDACGEMGRKIREGVGSAIEWVRDKANEAKIAVEGLWGAMISLHNEIAKRLGRAPTGPPFGYMGEGGGEDLSGYGPPYAHAGTETGIVDIPGLAPGPKPLAKAGGGGKSPAALDAEQMDNALTKADQTMQKLTEDNAKLGSEAQMAAKASNDSYADLAAKVQADFEAVKQKHAEMVAAIESGSKKAASEATAAWHNAVEKWKTDFDEAKARAQADMKEIKSYADTMASEVSGILNSAISGKLNWAQELDKVLGKMIDELTKYVFEMIALMLKGESMSQAAQTAGQNNMVGELIGWVGKMLGIKTASNAADTAQQTTHEAAITTAKTTAQATQTAVLTSGLAAQTAILKANAVTQGTSQAGVAAANTMAALTPIPYVGPAIAAATAPTIFSETMAYAVAEAGFDVPPGLKPLTQLHPREMVLPESLATGVRNMTSGSASGIPGAQVNQNINLQAWDGQSVVDMLLGNGGAIAGALQGALRSGLVLNTGG